MLLNIRGRLLPLPRVAAVRSNTNTTTAARILLTLRRTLHVTATRRTSDSAAAAIAAQEEETPFDTQQHRHRNERSQNQKQFKDNTFWQQTKPKPTHDRPKTTPSENPASTITNTTYTASTTPSSTITTPSEFYSREFTPKPAEILGFLQRIGWYHRPNKFEPHQLEVKCPNPIRHGETRWATGRLDRDTGNYFCTKCSLAGGFHVFANKAVAKSPYAAAAAAAATSSDMSAGAGGGGGGGAGGGGTRGGFADTMENMEMYPERWTDEEIGRVVEMTGVSRETLKVYGVGVTVRNAQGKLIVEDDDVSDGAGSGAWGDEGEVEGETYVTYPLIGKTETGENAVVRLKMVPLEMESEATSGEGRDGGGGGVVGRMGNMGNSATKTVTPALMDPAKGSVGPGMFGFGTVPVDETRLIICGTEKDAMAVYEKTGMPAVSLEHQSRLPVALLPLLERFVRIDLWLDDTVQGIESAKRHARKLGPNRTYIINSSGDGGDGPVSASAAVARGVDVRGLVESGGKPRVDHLLSFGNLRSLVQQHVLNPDMSAGVGSKVLPELDNVLKGLRRGELTILSGPTGAGKTTVLSHLSFDWAEQDVPTIWGSFEIPNHRLVQKMMCQAKGLDLTYYPEEFDKVANYFDRLPMHFLDFFGSTSLDKVIAALTYSAYAHDVGLVIIDNLQFMMSGQQHQGGGESGGAGGSPSNVYHLDKYSLQDEAVAAFRKFATDSNVHVVLVVHPRKQEGDLSIHSIYGSVKTTQEADNVVLLGKRGGHKYLSFKKQRFDGTLGDIPYKIDSSSKALSGYTEDEQIEFVRSMNAVQEAQRSQQQQSQQ